MASVPGRSWSRRDTGGHRPRWLAFEGDEIGAEVRSELVMLPRRVHYALQALQHLARHGQAYQPAHAIASGESLPGRFLDLILTELKDAGLVESLRGMGGGYRLVPDPVNISLLDILDAMGITLVPLACIEQRDERCAGCNARECTLKGVFEAPYRRYRGHLATVSLADLAFPDPGLIDPASASLNGRV